MAVNTKIQFRRGYSTGYTGNTIANPALPENANDPNYTRPTASFQWAEEIVLAEGEIGYEIDTGKFKIGRVSVGSLMSWVSLPYAGGSALTSQSGIGLVFDESNNAYTLYSYITGSDPNNSGISFSTTPLSGILGNENALGTAYVINLSDKLENFNDSNIAINTNTINSSVATDGTGIIISGYNQSEIALNPFGGTVTVSGVDVHNLFIESSDDITVTEAVGGLSKGTVLNNASGITEVLRTILEKVFEPTLQTQPFVSITSSYAPTRVEAGTNISSNFTLQYNPGSIIGAGTGAAWNPTTKQANAGGSVQSYRWTVPGSPEANIGLNTTQTVSNKQILQGNNTFSVRADYADGPSLVNSVEQTASLTPLVAGTTSAASRTIVGYRPLFYGVIDSDNDIPTSNNDLLSLTKLDASSPYNVNGLNGLTIPAGTKKVIVAVPSGWAGFSNNISVINDANLPETYTTTVISVTGANGYGSLNYFVHYYIPASPFAVNTVHKINVS